LRLRGTSAQSRDRTISVACTIEPRSLFDFPSCIKVRNVRKEILQFCCHNQHRKPPTPGKVANSEKLPFPQSGYRHRETPQRPQTCGVPLFKASPTRRALNSLPLVNSDVSALTPLASAYIQYTGSLAGSY